MRNNKSIQLLFKSLLHSYRTERLRISLNREDNVHSQRWFLVHHEPTANCYRSNRWCLSRCPRNENTGCSYPVYDPKYTPFQSLSITKSEFREVCLERLASRFPRHALKRKGATWSARRSKIRPLLRSGEATDQSILGESEFKRKSLCAGR